jgi:biotin operon repressor
MTRPESNLVSGEELARWLGLSGKEVYDLEKAGIIVRVGRA